MCALLPGKLLCPPGRASEAFSSMSWWVVVLLFLAEERCGRCEDALLRSSFSGPSCWEFCLQYSPAVSPLPPGAPSSECLMQGATSWLAHLNSGQL